MVGKGDGVQKPRRFYKAVTVGELDGGFGPLLDGRSPKTPAGNRLVAPTPALAQLLADEWDAQAVEIDATQMPALRLAATAIDRVSQVREEVADEVARYAGSDLTCYRAQSPASLVAAQDVAWDPLLGWAAEELAVVLAPVGGILHVAQPATSLERVRALALELDDFGLTALAQAAGLFGSAIMALALQRGQLDGQGAHDAARVDEAFQEERWGVDHEAAHRTALRLEEALLLERWFRAL